MPGGAQQAVTYNHAVVPARSSDTVHGNQALLGLGNRETGVWLHTGSMSLGVSVQ